MSKRPSVFGRVIGRIYRSPQWVLVTLVKAYRLLLSPSLGSSCRFEPTCSVYSLQALQAYGAVAGTCLTVHRVVRCHPWCQGGYDPVPAEWPSWRSGASRPGALFTRLVTPVATPSSAPPEKKSS